ncbi:NB-ARC domain-containing protein [Heracleum sosnowskyi]|uniref:NB-ARC domain-containing protein n=1 Tax=Heracleum sosnowskyi TaxID=360622 RepID=A0AAD8MUN0_9APIA|nr:NB-ARC domain-containing protein [Heracleum sosnowskyi]
MSTHNLITNTKVSPLCKIFAIGALLYCNKFVQMAEAVAAAATSVQAFIALAPIVKGSLSWPPQKVKRIPAPDDIRGYKTLEEPLEAILFALNPQIKLRGIEISGAIGVGKTTIMQNLNNHDEVAKLFDIVIWLDVSSDNLETFGKKKNLGLEELQTKVMRRLNLDTTSIPSDEYKAKIEEKLETKKYLLLLDNVKESVNLDEIGFPNNWEKKGSKIVLTTRYKRVCPLIVDYTLEIELLSPPEARRMFSEIFKPTNPESRKLMELGLKRCFRLPFAIKIIAGYCRSLKGEKTWRDKLNSLTHFPVEGDDVINEMCKHLSACYEDLEDDKLDCFCYSALYSEDCDIYIDRLLDCWLAENFLLKTDRDKADRAHGRKILQDLNDRNLFQTDELEKCVRMHKLIRLVALHKLQNDKKHNFLVLSNEEFLDQSYLDRWNGKHWISFADNKNLIHIPDSLDCSKLSTLFLQENSKFEGFPDSFFTKAGSLCVLDLMGTSIEYLPESLLNAKKLAVLYLNECAKLLKLPSEIGNLTHLQVLDISGSGVNDVPLTIKRLERLKRFFVPSNAFREKDFLDVISSLTELQEMVIDTKSEKETYDWGIIDDVMRSVENLTHLTNLQFRFLKEEVVDVIKVVRKVIIVCVPKEDNLKYFVTKKEIDSSLFKVFIGCPISEEVNIRNCERFSRYVKYYNGNEPSPTSVLELVRKADAFVIDNHDQLEHLKDFDFSKASAIRVDNCKKIRYMFYQSCSALSNLEILCLSDLKELKILWEGSIHLNSLQKLKTLHLTRCPELIVIITLAAVQGQLKFQNLEELVLVDMKKLTSICDNVSLEYPALTTLKISPEAKQHFQKLPIFGIPTPEVMAMMFSLDSLVLESVPLSLLYFIR